MPKSKNKKRSTAVSGTSRSKLGEHGPKSSSTNDTCRAELPLTINGSGVDQLCASSVKVLSDSETITSVNQGGLTKSLTPVNVQKKYKEAYVSEAEIPRKRTSSVGLTGAESCQSQCKSLNVATFAKNHLSTSERNAYDNDTCVRGDVLHLCDSGAVACCFGENIAESVMRVRRSNYKEVREAVQMAIADETFGTAEGERHQTGIKHRTGKQYGSRTSGGSAEYRNLNRPKGAFNDVHGTSLRRRSPSEQRGSLTFADSLSGMAGCRASQKELKRGKCAVVDEEEFEIELFSDCLPVKKRLLAGTRFKKGLSVVANSGGDPASCENLHKNTDRSYVKLDKVPRRSGTSDSEKVKKFSGIFSADVLRPARRWFTVSSPPAGGYYEGVRATSPSHAAGRQTSVRVAVTASDIEDDQLNGIGLEKLRLWKMSRSDVEELQEQVRVETKHQRTEHIMPLVMAMSESEIETAYQGVVGMLKDENQRDSSVTDDKNVDRQRKFSAEEAADKKQPSSTCPIGSQDKIATGSKCVFSEQTMDACSEQFIGCIHAVPVGIRTANNCDSPAQSRDARDRNIFMQIKGPSLARSAVLNDAVRTPHGELRALSLDPCAAGETAAPLQREVSKKRKCTDFSTENNSKLHRRNTVSNDGDRHAHGALSQRSRTRAASCNDSTFPRSLRPVFHPSVKSVVTKSQSNGKNAAICGNATADIDTLFLPDKPVERKRSLQTQQVRTSVDEPAQAVADVIASDEPVLPVNAGGSSVCCKSDEPTVKDGLGKRQVTNIASACPAECESCENSPDDCSKEVSKHASETRFEKLVLPGESHCDDSHLVTVPGLACKRVNAEVESEVCVNAVAVNSADDCSKVDVSDEKAVDAVPFRESSLLKQSESKVTERKATCTKHTHSKHLKHWDKRSDANRQVPSFRKKSTEGIKMAGLSSASADVPDEKPDDEIGRVTRQEPTSAKPSCCMLSGPTSQLTNQQDLIDGTSDLERNVDRELHERAEVERGNVSADSVVTVAELHERVTASTDELAAAEKDSIRIRHVSAPVSDATSAVAEPNVPEDPSSLHCKAKRLHRSFYDEKREIDRVDRTAINEERTRVGEEVKCEVQTFDERSTDHVAVVRGNTDRSARLDSTSEVNVESQKTVRSAGEQVNADEGCSTGIQACTNDRHAPLPDLANDPMASTVHAGGSTRKCSNKDVAIPKTADERKSRHAKSKEIAKNVGHDLGRRSNKRDEKNIPKRDGKKESAESESNENSKGCGAVENLSLNGAPVERGTKNGSSVLAEDLTESRLRHDEVKDSDYSCKFTEKLSRIDDAAQFSRTHDVIGPAGDARSVPLCGKHISERPVSGGVSRKERFAGDVNRSVSRCTAFIGYRKSSRKDKYLEDGSQRLMSSVTTGKSQCHSKSSGDRMKGNRSRDNSHGRYKTGRESNSRTNDNGITFRSDDKIEPQHSNSEPVSCVMDEISSRPVAENEQKCASSCLNDKQLLTAEHETVNCSSRPSNANANLGEERNLVGSCADAVSLTQLNYNLQLAELECNVTEKLNESFEDNNSSQSSKSMECNDKESAPVVRHRVRSCADDSRTACAQLPKHDTNGSSLSDAGPCEVLKINESYVQSQLVSAPSGSVRSFVEPEGTAGGDTGCTAGREGIEPRVINGEQRVAEEQRDIVGNDEINDCEADGNNTQTVCLENVSSREVVQCCMTEVGNLPNEKVATDFRGLVAEERREHCEDAVDVSETTANRVNGEQDSCCIATKVPETLPTDRSDESCVPADSAAQMVIRSGVSASVLDVCDANAQPVETDCLLAVGCSDGSPLTRSLQASELIPTDCDIRSPSPCSLLCGNENSASVSIIPSSPCCQLDDQSETDVCHDTFSAALSRVHSADDSDIRSPSPCDEPPQFFRARDIPCEFSVSQNVSSDIRTIFDGAIRSPSPCNLEACDVRVSLASSVSLLAGSRIPREDSLSKSTVEVGSFDRVPSLSVDSGSSSPCSVRSVTQDSELSSATSEIQSPDQSGDEDNGDGNDGRSKVRHISIHRIRQPAVIPLTVEEAALLAVDIPQWADGELTVRDKPLIIPLTVADDVALSQDAVGPLNGPAVISRDAAVNEVRPRTIPLSVCNESIRGPKTIPLEVIGSPSSEEMEVPVQAASGSSVCNCPVIIPLNVDEFVSSLVGTVVNAE